MWQYEYTAETSKPAGQIWARYADHRTWTEWDRGLEAVELEGEFEPGAVGQMTPRGQGPIPFVVVDLDRGRAFTDETRMDGVVLRFAHTLDPTADGGTRVTHRVTIDGPAAPQLGPVIGPRVTAEIPASVQLLVELA